MAHIGKQIVVLLLVTRFGFGLAQNPWSGLVFGLPDEAARLGLYVLDFEALTASGTLSGGGQSGGGTSSSESADFRELYRKVAAGTLGDDGTFGMGTNLEAVEAMGRVLPPRRIFGLLNLVVGEKLVVVPEDARVSVVVFGVEDSRGDYIGSIVPRGEVDGLSITYPYLLLAGEPTLIEGSLWEPENGIMVVYDATMPQGFSLLRTGAEVNFFDPKMVVDTISESPSEWVYHTW